jgi:hypothetical protein
MTTQDERKDLMKEPLPLQPVTIAVLDYEKNCPADRVLTNILLIDEQIQSIQNAVSPHLTALNMQRNALLARALKEQILSDDNAMLLGIEGKQFRNEIEDLEAFQLAFPEGYTQIRAAQRKDLDDKHDTKVRELEDSDIPLGLADKKVGKDKVTDFVGYQPVKVTYEVRKRIKTD